MVPSLVTPQRRRAARSSSGMVMITVLGVPPVSGSVPERSSRSHTSSSGVVHALGVVAGVGFVDGAAVVEDHRLQARFGERSEDRVELGADGSGEAAFERVHAVASACGG